MSDKLFTDYCLLLTAKGQKPAATKSLFLKEESVSLDGSKDTDEKTQGAFISGGKRL